MVTILEVLGKEIINDKQVKTWIEGGIQDMFEWICIWIEIELNTENRRVNFKKQTILFETVFTWWITVILSPKCIKITRSIIYGY